MSQLKCYLDYDQFSAVTIYFKLGLAQVYNISDHCVVAILLRTGAIVRDF